MLALGSVFVVVALSLLITRIATVALVLTGMSREAARFQARSALSGVGFTTSEAESVVTHPVRRRIVLLLMLVGSAGFVSVAATLILSFSGAERGQALARMGILVVGLFALVWLSRSRWVDRRLSAVIARGLQRWTDLEVRDYQQLLHLGGRYAVTELAVQEGDWLDGRCLRDARLREEGIAVLGVERPSGEYVGVPGPGTELHAGDVVIAYGQTDRLAEIDRRGQGPEGDAAHERAVREERERAAREAAAAG